MLQTKTKIKTEPRNQNRKSNILWAHGMCNKPVLS